MLTTRFFWAPSPKKISTQYASGCASSTKVTFWNLFDACIFPRDNGPVDKRLTRCGSILGWYNLKRLLQRLSDKGLRCCWEKCSFAQHSIEYLGHLLSQDGIAKGPKVDGVQKMPAPTNVQSLQLFLGWIQLYSKFLPNLLMTLEPLYQLTKKGASWNWGEREETVFRKAREALTGEHSIDTFQSVPASRSGLWCIRRRDWSSSISRIPGW